jgi:RimJ/RimL family protein N-acetyltransferase
MTTMDDILGPVLDWQPAREPQRTVLHGIRVRLEPIDAGRHATQLYAASHGPEADPRLWDYMSVGPFADEARFTNWVEGCAASNDPLFHAVVDQATGRALGVVSYMRIAAGQGVIEIGNIWFGTGLPKTPAATETIFILARHVFDDLGYRRLEWKCNALNEPSRRAALRFGFSYEGLFRQHMVIKGRNRDTTWFAMTDGDWPAIKTAFETWLAPDNFDASGRQIRGLAEIRGLR